MQNAGTEYKLYSAIAVQFFF